MSYQARYQSRAKKEFRDATEWYRDKSEMAADNFTKAINESLDTIEKQPDRFRKTYKNFRDILLKKYPYTIIYLVDEEHKLIIISSIFHQKRNPKTKYKNLK
jgi:plasmid stabilization system protein ParE